MTITLEGAHRTMVLEVSGDWDTDHILVTALDRYISNCQATTPMQWFRVTPQPEPLEWLYRIKHQDDRLWKQVILVPAVGIPSMDFTVNAKWTVPEFAPLRDLRDQVIKMIQAGLVSIECTWT